MDATFKYFDSVGNGKSDFANEHQSIIYSWIPLLLIGILLNAFTVRKIIDESYHFYHYYQIREGNICPTFSNKFLDMAHCIKIEHGVGHQSAIGFGMCGKNIHLHRCYANQVHVLLIRMATKSTYSAGIVASPK